MEEGDDPTKGCVGLPTSPAEYSRLGRQLQDWLALPSLKADPPSIRAQEPQSQQQHRRERTTTTSSNDRRGQRRRQERIQRNYHDDSETIVVDDDYDDDGIDEVYDVDALWTTRTEEWIMKHAEKLVDAIIGPPPPAVVTTDINPTRRRRRPRSPDRTAPRDYDYDSYNQQHQHYHRTSATAPRQHELSSLSQNRRGHRETPVVDRLWEQAEQQRLAAASRSTAAASETTAARESAKARQREAYRELERFVTQLEANKQKRRQRSSVMSISSMEDSVFFEAVKDVLSTEQPTSSQREAESSQRVYQAAIEALSASGRNRRDLDSLSSPTTSAGTTDEPQSIPTKYRNRIPPSAQTPVVQGARQRRNSSLAAAAAAGSAGDIPPTSRLANNRQPRQPSQTPMSKPNSPLKPRRRPKQNAAQRRKKNSSPRKSPPRRHSPRQRAVATNTPRSRKSPEKAHWTRTILSPKAATNTILPTSRFASSPIRNQENVVKPISSDDEAESRQESDVYSACTDPRSRNTCIPKITISDDDEHSLLLTDDSSLRRLAAKREPTLAKLSPKKSQQPASPAADTATTTRSGTKSPIRTSHAAPFHTDEEIRKMSSKIMAVATGRVEQRGGVLLPPVDSAASSSASSEPRSSFIAKRQCLPESTPTPSTRTRLQQIRRYRKSLGEKNAAEKNDDGLVPKSTSSEKSVDQCTPTERRKIYQTAQKAFFGRNQRPSPRMSGLSPMSAASPNSQRSASPSLQSRSERFQRMRNTKDSFVPRPAPEELVSIDFPTKRLRSTGTGRSVSPRKSEPPPRPEDPVAESKNIVLNESPAFEEESVSVALFSVETPSLPINGGGSLASSSMGASPGQSESSSPTTSENLESGGEFDASSINAVVPQEPLLLSDRSTVASSLNAIAGSKSFSSSQKSSSVDRGQTNSTDSGMVDTGSLSSFERTAIAVAQRIKKLTDQPFFRVTDIPDREVAEGGKDKQKSGEAVTNEGLVDAGNTLQRNDRIPAEVSSLCQGSVSNHSKIGSSENSSIQLPKDCKKSSQRDERVPANQTSSVGQDSASTGLLLDAPGSFSKPAEPVIATQRDECIPANLSMQQLDDPENTVEGDDCSLVSKVPSLGRKTVSKASSSANDGDLLGEQPLGLGTTVLGEYISAKTLPSIVQNSGSIEPAVGVTMNLSDQQLEGSRNVVARDDCSPAQTMLSLGQKCSSTVSSVDVPMDLPAPTPVISGSTAEQDECMSLERASSHGQKHISNDTSAYTPVHQSCSSRNTVEQDECIPAETVPYFRQKDPESVGSESSTEQDVCIGAEPVISLGQKSCAQKASIDAIDDVEELSRKSQPVDVESISRNRVRTSPPGAPIHLHSPPKESQDLSSIESSHVQEVTLSCGGSNRLSMSCEDYNAGSSRQATSLDIPRESCTPTHSRNMLNVAASDLTMCEVVGLAADVPREAASLKAKLDSDADEIHKYGSGISRRSVSPNDLHGQSSIGSLLTSKGLRPDQSSSKESVQSSRPVGIAIEPRDVELNKNVTPAPVQTLNLGLEKEPDKIGATDELQVLDMVTDDEEVQSTTTQHCASSVTCTKNNPIRGSVISPAPGSSSLYRCLLDDIFAEEEEEAVVVPHAPLLSYEKPIWTSESQHFACHDFINSRSIGTPSDVVHVEGQERLLSPFNPPNEVHTQSSTCPGGIIASVSRIEPKLCDRIRGENRGAEDHTLNGLAEIDRMRAPPHSVTGCSSAELVIEPYTPSTDEWHSSKSTQAQAAVLSKSCKEASDVSKTIPNVLKEERGEKQLDPSRPFSVEDAPVAVETCQDEDTVIVRNGCVEEAIAEPSEIYWTRPQPLEMVNFEVNESGDWFTFSASSDNADKCEKDHSSTSSDRITCIRKLASIDGEKTPAPLRTEEDSLFKVITSNSETDRKLTFADTTSPIFKKNSMIDNKISKIVASGSESDQSPTDSTSPTTIKDNSMINRNCASREELATEANNINVAISTSSGRRTQRSRKRARVSSGSYESSEEDSIAVSEEPSQSIPVTVAHDVVQDVINLSGISALEEAAIEEHADELSESRAADAHPCVGDYPLVVQASDHQKLTVDTLADIVPIVVEGKSVRYWYPPNASVVYFQDTAKHETVGSDFTKSPRCTRARDAVETEFSQVEIGRQMSQVSPCVPADQNAVRLESARDLHYRRSDLGFSILGVGMSHDITMLHENKTELEDTHSSESQDLASLQKCCEQMRMSTEQSCEPCTSSLGSSRDQITSNASIPELDVDKYERHSDEVTSTLILMSNDEIELKLDSHVSKKKMDTGRPTTRPARFFTFSTASEDTLHHGDDDARMNGLSVANSNNGGPDDCCLGPAMLQKTPKKVNDHLENVAHGSGYVSVNGGDSSNLLSHSDSSSRHELADSSHKAIPAVTETAEHCQRESSILVSPSYSILNGKPPKADDVASTNKNSPKVESVDEECTSPSNHQSKTLAAFEPEVSSSKVSGSVCAEEGGERCSASRYQQYTATKSNESDPMQTGNMAFATCARTPSTSAVKVESESSTSPLHTPSPIQAVYKPQLATWYQPLRKEQHASDEQTHSSTIGQRLVSDDTSDLRSISQSSDTRAPLVHDTEHLKTQRSKTSELKARTSTEAKRSSDQSREVVILDVDSSLEKDGLPENHAGVVELNDNSEPTIPSVNVHDRESSQINESVKRQKENKGVHGEVSDLSRGSTHSVRPVGRHSADSQAACAKGLTAIDTDQEGHKLQNSNLDVKYTRIEAVGCCPHLGGSCTSRDSRSSPTAVDTALETKGPTQTNGIINVESLCDGDTTNSDGRTLTCKKDISKLAHLQSVENTAGLPNGAHTQTMHRPAEKASTMIDLTSIVIAPALDRNTETLNLGKTASSDFQPAENISNESVEANPLRPGNIHCEAHKSVKRNPASPTKSVSFLNPAVGEEGRTDNRLVSTEILDGENVKHSSDAIISKPQSGIGTATTKVLHENLTPLRHQLHTNLSTIPASNVFANEISSGVDWDSQSELIKGIACWPPALGVDWGNLFSEEALLHRIGLARPHTVGTIEYPRPQNISQGSEIIHLEDLTDIDFPNGQLNSLETIHEVDESSAGVLSVPSGLCPIIPKPQAAATKIISPTDDEIRSISPFLVDQFDQAANLLDRMTDSNETVPASVSEISPEVIHISTGDSWNAQHLHLSEGHMMVSCLSDDDGLSDEIESLVESVKLLQNEMVENTESTSGQVALLPKQRDALVVVDLTYYDDDHCNDQLCKQTGLICASKTPRTRNITKSSCAPTQTITLHEESFVENPHDDEDVIEIATEDGASIESSSTVEAIETIFVEECFRESDVFTYGELEGYVFDWIKDDSTPEIISLLSKEDKQPPPFYSRAPVVASNLIQKPEENVEKKAKRERRVSNEDASDPPAAVNTLPFQEDPPDTFFRNSSRSVETSASLLSTSDLRLQVSDKTREELMMPRLEHERDLEGEAPHLTQGSKRHINRYIFRRQLGGRKEHSSLTRVRQLFQQRQKRESCFQSTALKKRSHKQVFARRLHVSKSRESVPTMSRLERARKYLLRRKALGLTPDRKPLCRDDFEACSRDRISLSAKSVDLHSSDSRENLKEKMQRMPKSIREMQSPTPIYSSYISPRDSTSTVTLPLVLQSATEANSPGKSSSPGSKSSLTVGLPSFWEDYKIALKTERPNESLSTEFREDSKGEIIAGTSFDTRSTLTVPLPRDLTSLLRRFKSDRGDKSESSLTMRLLAGDSSIESTSKTNTILASSIPSQHSGKSHSRAQYASFSSSSSGKADVTKSQPSSVTFETESQKKSIASDFLSQGDDPNAWFRDSFPNSLFLDVHETTDPCSLPARKKVNKQVRDGRLVAETPMDVDAIPTTVLTPVGEGHNFDDFQQEPEKQKSQLSEKEMSSRRSMISGVKAGVSIRQLQASIRKKKAQTESELLQLSLDQKLITQPNATAGTANNQNDPLASSPVGLRRGTRTLARSLPSHVQQRYSFAPSGSLLGVALSSNNLESEYHPTE